MDTNKNISLQVSTSAWFEQVMLMEQLSDLLNMNVEESMGKKEFTENQSVIMIMLIAWLCSPFFLNYWHISATRK